MYRRTEQAAVWSGVSVDQSPTVAPGRDQRAAADRTIWARVPLQTKHGRCLAVRQKDGELWVGIAGAPLRWLPARRVLTDKEAEAWAATGF